MQTIRRNITRLITMITNNIPDEEDVFGFKGISKENLVAVLNEAHQFSYKLNELESSFEVTVLKRKLAKRFDGSKKIFELKNEKDIKESFDALIDFVISIRDQIRTTYMVVVSNVLKDEGYYLQLTENIEKLSIKHEEYSKYLEEIQKIKEYADSVNESSTEYAENIKSYHDEVVTFHEETESIKSKISTSFDMVTKYESEIETKNSEAKSNSKEINDLLLLSKKLEESSSKHEKSFQELLTNINEQIERNEINQEDINRTLEAANRVGMASSFKIRKDELKWSIRLWIALFVISVSSIFIFGVTVIVPEITQSSNALLSFDLLPKYLITAPLIWLAWMSARQYGFVARIREDYAFKLASAMAFEGYKKQAHEIDPDMEKQLLAVSIEQMALNPIRLYSAKDNHASPITETCKNMWPFNKNKSTKNSLEDEE